MNPAQWREVKAVLQQALNMPLPQRRTFVDDACRDRPDLLSEVESLLAAHDAAAVGDDHLVAAVDAGIRAVARPIQPLSETQLRDRLQAALASQFDVLGTLGSGGMGAVYLAHERSLGRTVAIKVLRPDRADTPGSRERFRREARIAAQLSHPGIVPLYSFGEVDGLWYFVMEHVRGPTLAERLENENRLPPDEVHRILLAVADALDHAHRRGVIHRDIKPANILLDDASGRPRLADFGISTLEGSTDDLTATGAFVGTPLFMSPEQAETGTEVDGRSDLYSLGAVAYAMLAGRAPFSGVSAADVLSRRRREEPLPLLDLVPSLSPDLAHIVMRCLERDRHARWRDASSLRDALRNSGDTDAPELPPDIAELPGYAAYALVWMALWTAFAFSTGRSPSSRVLLMIVALLVPMGPALHIWRVRARGTRASQLLRLVLRPPTWWGTWWPAALRHPNDVWPLLPPIARAGRIGVALFCLLLLVAALAADRTGAAAHLVWNVLMALLVVGTTIFGLLAWRWALRHALGFDRTMQFLFASTSPSAFWQDTQIAPLLTASATRARYPAPVVPTDYPRAAADLVRGMPESLAAAGERALRAVRHQTAMIARTDREIAMLARDAGPSESGRLAARLALLDGEETATIEQRELADTVRRELDLIRTIQGQHTLAVARRDAQVAQLRAVWARLIALAAVGSGDGEVLAEAVARVQALSDRLLETDAPTGDEAGDESGVSKDAAS